jgi:probable F420-dependent oxidoreductase
MVTFGVATFSTDYSVRPDEFAKAAEERGFGSVFFPEHTHIPTSRKTPFPMGGELPKDYSHLHDLFIAMTAAAMATTRIKIGAGVCLITEHDPIHLAKQVASLDALSNGRVILGIGAGWNAEEMEDHGVSFKKRWRVTGERVKAIKRIWREDTAEFHGEFVNFDPIWCWPKPVQAGGPPVWMGSLSPKSLERVVEYCDGWMPVEAPVEALRHRLQALRAAASRGGRKFEEIELGIAVFTQKDDTCKRFIDLGFTHLVLAQPSESRDRALKRLDEAASIAAKVNH